MILLDRVLILKLNVFTGSNDVVYTKSSSLILCVSLRVQKHYICVFLVECDLSRICCPGNLLYFGSRY